MAEYDERTSEYDRCNTYERISGETGSLKLYAYGTDGTLKEVTAEKWHIQTEDGETPDTLSEDVLYEVHMIVEDGGDFDLSETEKEIKISAVQGA